MKPLFKNITKYNKKNYEQFLEFHSNKYSFSYNLYTITMTILLFFCITLNIVEKNVKYLLFFSCILLAFLLYRIYFPLKRHDKTQKKLKNNEETQCSYSFYKWYFTLNDQTFYYFKLYKVFETKDYFYIYLNDEKASLVNKKGFTSGSSEEFSKFIKKKCLLKYRKES